MKIYIARDIDNDLRLFNHRPYSKNGIFRCENIEDDYMFIDSDLFPQITFENSPQEVELKLV